MIYRIVHVSPSPCCRPAQLRVRIVTYVQPAQTDATAQPSHHFLRTMVAIRTALPLWAVLCASAQGTDAFSSAFVPSAKGVVARSARFDRLTGASLAPPRRRARCGVLFSGSADADKQEDTSVTLGEDDGGLNFDRLAALFTNFKEMALPYYQESKAGRWLFAGMVGITLLNSGVSVAFSYVGKDFWNALSSKDAANFYPMLAKYAAALVVGMPVSVLYRFQRERLAVAWREWMTDRTLQLYSSNRVYYALERGGEVDNPDQRIAEDVRSFTTFSLQLVSCANTVWKRLSLTCMICFF